MQNKKPLIGLRLPELQELLGNQPAFRAKQLYEFLYAKREDSSTSILDCSVLPKTLRESLDQEWCLYSSVVDCRISDKEGAVKFRLRLADGSLIESVSMVDGKGRKTACLSSQVGCKMGCRFCRTAQLGFKRNLTAGEILEQLKWLERETGAVSNIVFMGMGEPTDNLSEVLKAIEILTDEKGFGMGHRRITLSSCGVATGIEKLGEAQTGIRLAISLNNAIDSERQLIMPITKRFPLAILKESIRKFQELSGGKRITLEYVMLRDQNMTAKHAEAIVHFAKGLKVMVNLIPLNGSPDLDFSVPTEKDCAQFEKRLKDMGLNVTRRWSKGGSIAGACGQLAGDKKAKSSN